MASPSSMGKSTTVMKSVPSPGSPSHTPSGVTPWLAAGCCCAILACSSSIAFGSMSADVSPLASGITSSASGASAVSCASSLALASASAASRAAISSSSFFDLRPRFLGAGFTSSSSAAAASLAAFCSSSFALASASANKSSSEGCFVFLGFVALGSKLSPSAPFTV